MICNDCKNFLRVSFCKKCRIHGIQFSLHRTYFIPLFLAYCTVLYSNFTNLEKGVDIGMGEFAYDPSTIGWVAISFKGHIHHIILGAGGFVLPIVGCFEYLQRRNRRTVRIAIKNSVELEKPKWNSTGSPLLAKKRQVKSKRS